MENRFEYVPARLDIVRLKSADVIATSVPAAPDAWGGDGNIDSGGWT